jgi:hypothetical protein
MSATTIDTPSEAELRKALAARINSFLVAAGMSKSEFGRKAVNDVAFLTALEAGRNITLKSYEKVRKFLDANDPTGRGVK